MDGTSPRPAKRSCNNKIYKPKRDITFELRSKSEKLKYIWCRARYARRKKHAARIRSEPSEIDQGNAINTKACKSAQCVLQQVTLGRIPIRTQPITVSLRKVPTEIQIKNHDNKNTVCQSHTPHQNTMAVFRGPI